MADLKEISSNKCHGGWQKVFEHTSRELKCKMRFGIYLPPKCEEEKVPTLYWLSGLTCTEQNFITKSGAQAHASALGIAIVAPDTSPRGCGIEGEDESYDFGTGAGFYVDATEEKWKTNYRMFTYISMELPILVQNNFPLQQANRSIAGHSMGGHGALVCAFKNPGLYKSVSAFAPICNPMNCPWGQKAFTGYLGADRNAWKEWDATELAKDYQGPAMSYIFIDQGGDDEFLKQGQLLPKNFIDACEGKVPAMYRLQEGYDHSYYFISSFIEDHMKHHAEALYPSEDDNDD